MRIRIAPFCSYGHSAERVVYRWLEGVAWHCMSCVQARNPTMFYWKSGQEVKAFSTYNEFWYGNRFNSSLLDYPEWEVNGETHSLRILEYYLQARPLTDRSVHREGWGGYLEAPGHVDGEQSPLELWGPSENDIKEQLMSEVLQGWKPASE